MMTKRPTKKISILLATFGAILIAVSIDYSDETIALIGLTLLLWGVVLLNSSPDKYIHSKILLYSNNNLKKLYDAIFQNIKLEGLPIYYSPENIWGFSNVIIMIGKNNESKISEISESDGFEIMDDHLVIMPPGMALSDLIEEELNTNVASMELSDFNVNVKKAVVDQLELADEIDIQINNEDFIINITKSLFNQELIDYHVDFENDKLIGDSLVSAIICLLAKIIHKPLFIEYIDYNSANLILKSKVKIL